MNPLIDLLAFTLAALVTYVLVLGLLTALSIPDHQDDTQSASEPVERGERAVR